MQKLNYVLLGLLCLPVFFVNISGSHDWGDDFAQYIHQARNITEGKSQAETGYIYNDDMFLGPKAYPVGFPLMLAPVYAASGNSIKAFNYYISFILYACCFLFFYFFRKYFSALVSFLLVLIILYNPWTFNFKMEVMSEIPFTLFLLLSYLLYGNSSGSRYNYLLAGICGGFLICIRNVGLVFPMAIALDTLHRWYLLRKFGPAGGLKPLLIRSGTVLGIALLVYALFSFVIFSVPSAGFTSYPRLADAGGFWDVFLKNLVYNTAVFQAFFSHYEVGRWEFVLYITKSAMLVFLIVGMLKRIVNRIDFTDILVLLYLGAILVFPYGDAGFRFLFPVLPFFLYYVVLGIQSINIPFRTGRGSLALLLGAFVLLQYRISDEKLFSRGSFVLAGPQQAESAEAFDYIKANTPPGAVIAFCKPRALSLYAERSSIANSDRYSPQECMKKFREAGVSYYLVQKEITDEAMKNFLKENEAAIQPVWSNALFVLYK